MTAKFELPTMQCEMIFQAILDVLEKGEIEYDQKYNQLREQIRSYRETDITDLLDLLEPFYQKIKNNTNYDELDREDDITCSICGDTFEELKVNIVDYDDDICVSCESKLKINSTIMPFEKCVITIKDNNFAEVGHCFSCEIKGEKVTINNDVSCRSVTIPIEQFQDEFKEISKEDYEIFVEANNEGEDKVFEAIVKKYLNLYLN